MKLIPFRECVDKAVQLSNNSTGPVEIYQQWMCVGCGTRQTMEHPNTFYTEGRCEQCDRLSNLERDGCNFAIVLTRPRPKQTSS
jgi:hypothetical protein